MKRSVLILCSENFDEVMAVTFVAGLRSAGVRVQLVSTKGTLNRGRHGITVKCDLTLSDILSGDANIGALVLLPSPTLYLADPRFVHLLRRTVADDAPLIGPSEHMHFVQQKTVGDVPDARYVSYHAEQTIPEVTEQLIGLLL